MRKTIYQKISEALLALTQGGEPVIRHIDLWNNQLQYAEEEQPFDTPAAFIEFQPIEWRNQLHGVRDADVSIVLHIVTDSRVGRWSDTINTFDLLDSINAALHGIGTVCDNGSVMNALTLTSSTTDHDFGELQNNTETYTCHVTDMSGKR